MPSCEQELVFGAHKVIWKEDCGVEWKGMNFEEHFLIAPLNELRIPSFIESTSIPSVYVHSIIPCH